MIVTVLFFPLLAFSDSKVHITILHLNDVYEISPVSGGTQGGLARVATLEKQLREENPNTIAVLAGDLISPSALGTASIKGESLAGRQMVNVMNEVGLDYSTFGNHEFDHDAKTLSQRLQESNFSWISSNVSFNTEDPELKKYPRAEIREIPVKGESPIRLGLFGLTIPSNPKSYVVYKDYLQAAKDEIKEFKKQKVDIIIALTHLAIEQDRQLSKQFPEIDLILGGHEHENIHVERDPNRAPIYKADANARTAYIHDLTFNRKTKSLHIESRLQRVTDEIPMDRDVQKLVEEWKQQAFDAFRKMGFNPENPVAHPVLSR